MTIQEVFTALQDTIKKEGALQLPNDFPVKDNGIKTVLALLKTDTLTLSLGVNDITVNDKTIEIIGAKVKLFGITTPIVAGAIFTEVDEKQYITEVSCSLTKLSIPQLGGMDLIPLNKLPDPSIFGADLFDTIAVSARSNDSAMTLTVDNSTNKLTLLAAIGLSVEDYGFSITRTYDAFTGKTDTQFSLHGKFILGKTEAVITVSVPVSSMSVAGKWGVGLTSSTSLTRGITDFSKIFWGTDIFSVLPDAVKEIGSKFTLSSLAISFYPAKAKIGIIDVQITSLEPWEIIKDQFTILNTCVAFNLQWDDKGKIRTGITAAGKYQFGHDIELDVYLTMPPGNSDWQLSIQLEDNPKQIADLTAMESASIPGGFGDLETICLPDTLFSFKGLNINNFEIDFNPYKGTVAQLDVDLEVLVSWTIVKDVLTLSNPTLQLTALNPLNKSRTIYGSIGGKITIDTILIEVSCYKEDADSDWMIKAGTAEGTSIDLINITNQFLKPLAVQLPKSIFPTGLKITNLYVIVDLGKRHTEKKYIYTVHGETDGFWKFKLGALPEVDAKAAVTIKYDGNKTGNDRFSGNIGGSLVIKELYLDLDVAYEFKGGGEEKVTLTLWKEFQAIYEAKDKAGKPNKTLTISIKDWSVGDIISKLITLADPGLKNFSLPAPWDLLNKISLKGLHLTIDLETKKVDLGYTLPEPINLGFIKINGLTFNVVDGKVCIGIEGSSVISAINDSDLFKEGGQDVRKMPDVPGKGNKYFDLRLLALGQHVSINGASSFKNIEDAILAMRTFKEHKDNTVPISANPAPGAPMFNENSNWLIGTRFGILKFGEGKDAGYAVDLAVIFNDPELYGLRIALDGPKVKVFKGLIFEIMYKKITDTVGMYQMDFTLPDALRNLDFGEVSITLPCIGIEIYTNGDFKVDIGFPYKMDFSRSFSISALVYGVPVLGSGGFYFGKLSSATSTRVPKTTKGSFNPVLIFGIGLQLGLGRSIDKGILKAGFSITILGIIEGVIATYHPNNGTLNDGDDTAVEKSYYYWLQGTFGLQGILYGSIDFAIIQASVNIRVYVVAQATFEAYRAIPLAIIAGVDVSVKVKIDLGLFSISIHLSFHAKIKEELTIGTDREDEAPWYSGTSISPQANYVLLTGASNRIARTRATRSSLDNKAYMYRYGRRYLHPAGITRREPLFMANAASISTNDEKPSLNMYFIPHLTIAGDNTLAGQQAQYVAMLFMDCPDPTAAAGAPKTSFDHLCEEFFKWLIASHVQLSAGTPVQAEAVSYKELKDLYDTLSVKDTVMPLDPAAITDFLKNNFDRVTISAPTDAIGSAAVFPVFPDLMLTGAKSSFGDAAKCNKDYIKQVKDYFDQLRVQVENELAGHNQPSPLRADNPDDFPYTIAEFIFEEYFLLMAKQLLQYSLDGYKEFTYSLAPGDSLESIVHTMNSIGHSGDYNSLLVEDLAAYNQDHPLAPGKSIAITGLQHVIEAGDTLASIARNYALSSDVLVEQNKDNPDILKVGTVVTLKDTGTSYTVKAGDTITIVAGQLKTTVDYLAADSDFINQGDLLQETDFILISALIYPVKNNQALQDIALLYGVDPAALLMQNQLTPGLLIAGRTIVMKGNKHTVTSGDTAATVAVALKTTVSALAGDTTFKTRTDILQPLTGMLIPPFTHVTGASDTLKTVAATYSVTVDDLAVSYANAGLTGLFSTDGNTSLKIPGLDYLTITDLLAYIATQHGIANLSGMVSRYQLHGLRLPVKGKTGLKLPNDSPWAGKEDCPLYCLTGQQCAITLPVASDYSVGLDRNTVDWVYFDGSKTTKAITVSIGANREETARIKAVHDFATGTGLIPAILDILTTDNYDTAPAKFTFKSCAGWTNPGALTLAYGSLGDQKDIAPVIWNFPDSLIKVITAGKTIQPRFSIHTGINDRSNPAMSNSDTSDTYYSWSTMITVRIKKTAGSSGDGCNYELIGTDESGIAFLERLLSVIRPGNTPMIDTMHLVYQPAKAASKSPGYHCDGIENIKTFITQSNLSTETNPPSQLMMAVTEPEEEKTGILNDVYDFIRLLWQCSIVRSGGYYFYYTVLESNTGLPGDIFNDDGTADINLLITYTNRETSSNQLAPYMNAVVTGSKIDTGKDVVFALSEAQETTHTVSNTGTGGKTPANSLAYIASLYNTTLDMLAGANRDVVLGDVALDIDNIIYRVMAAGTSPGNDLDAIAAYYSTALTPLKASDITMNNPQITDFTDLAASTVLYIPAVTYTVSEQNKAGNTLASIGAYFKVNLNSLVFDNKDLPGIYPVGATLTVHDQFIDKTAKVTQGNIGFHLERSNPGDTPVLIKDKPIPPTYAGIYLNNLYNLLTFRVNENYPHNDEVGFNPSIYGLPAGPAKSLAQDEVQSDAVKPHAGNTEAPWEYDQVIPVSTYAKYNPIIDQTGLPTAKGNPYAGIGNYAEICFDWCDYYGNKTVNPFNNAGIAKGQPLNNIPVFVGYTDRLIPFSQWPGLNVTYAFTGDGTSSPVLSLDFTFDAAGYEPGASADKTLSSRPKSVQSESTDDSKQQDKARRDKYLYQTIYYQLNQVRSADKKNTVTITLETSLVDTGETALSDEQFTAINDFVKSAYRYLDALSRGKTASVPEMPPITRTIDTATLVNADIIELTVYLNLYRDLDLVDFNFKDTTLITAGRTKINPKTALPVSGTANDNKVSHQLLQFAKDFETAFYVKGAYVLKVATGINKGHAGQNDSKDVRIVRLSLKPGASIYYSINRKDVVFYAPSPLSTSLISKNSVPIYGYTSGTGISWDERNKVMKSFKGIDMDVWGKQCLEAIDRFLTPDYATPAFLLDTLNNTTMLQDIKDAKEQLADAIKEQLWPILEQPPIDPATNPANVKAAREKFKQQLLINLTNTYDITAVVQLAVDTDSTFENPDKRYVCPPRLYGKALAGDDNADTRGYSLSTAKIQLNRKGDADKSYLSFIFTAKNVKDQESMQLDLDYFISHLEYDIQTIDNIEGYEASSWLSFVLGPENNDPDVAKLTAPLKTALGTITIPIVLRAYPTVPSLSGQAYHDISVSSALSMKEVLQKVSDWNYTYTYSCDHVAQDTIHSQMQFNIRPAGLRADMALGGRDLFSDMAEFISVYPAIRMDFDRYLTAVTAKTKKDDPGLDKATAALTAFRDICTHLAQAWADRNRQAVTLTDGLSAPHMTTYNFSIKETDDSVTLPDKTLDNRLRITISPGTDNVMENTGGNPLNDDDITTPFVSLTGYHVMNAEDTQGKPIPDAYWYYTGAGKAKKFLSWERGRRIADRVVNTDELNVLEFQNARSSLVLIRNENIIPGNQTRSQFIYRTPQVSFIDKVIPLLDQDKYSDGKKIIIDLAGIGSTPPASYKDDRLTWYLSKFFEALFEKVKETGILGDIMQLVKVEVNYCYQLPATDNTDSPFIKLPVLLATPFDFHIPADYTTPASGPDKTASYKLAHAVNDWLTVNAVQTNNAYIMFDVSLFSTLNDNKLPLLRIRNVEVDYKDIK